MEKFPALGLLPGTKLYRTGYNTRVFWFADGKRKIDFLNHIGTDQGKYRAEAERLLPEWMSPRRYTILDQCRGRRAGRWIGGCWYRSLPVRL